MIGLLFLLIPLLLAGWLWLFWPMVKGVDTRTTLPSSEAERRAEFLESMARVTVGMHQFSEAMQALPLAIRKTQASMEKLATLLSEEPK